MIYKVILSLEAVEDVLRITMNNQNKASVFNASKLLQEMLTTDPTVTGEYLSEELYFLDQTPLRAFYTVDPDQMIVEIVNVNQV